MRKIIAPVFLVIVAMACGFLAYFELLQPCDELRIRAPEVPPIHSVGPFYVVTDQGRLWPGQTYDYQSEGIWVADHRLVMALGGHAAWITRYSVHDPTYHRAACRAMYP